MPLRAKPYTVTQPLDAEAIDEMFEILFSDARNGNLEIEADQITTPIDLTSQVTGVLPIANGGTNSQATPTDGGIVYGDGSSYQVTAVGTSGQVLTSNAGAAPTWETPTGGITAAQVAARVSLGF